MSTHVLSISFLVLSVALAASGSVDGQVMDVFGDKQPVAAVAKVTLGSGPHAGTYILESDVGCDIHPLDPGDPTSFLVVLATESMRLSRATDKPTELSMVTVSIPNVATTRLGELQFDVVFGDPARKARAGRASGTAYGIDTRPDSALKGFQREMRGTKGTHGRGSATLSDQGARATLEFRGETEKGTRVEGIIECRKVNRQ